MKKLTLITATLLATTTLVAQYNKIDTSFFSEALQETKMVDVYFPPGYDENPDWQYPVIYYLHSWNGDQNSVGGMLTFVQSLINYGSIAPVIMVGADNSPEPFEGNMYVNSPLWGNYEDYMIDDLISWVDASFRTIPERGGRALLGQSMGAYGAFRYGILHKDKFTAFAAHAGIVGLSKELWLDAGRQQVIDENQPGPPFSYDYSTGGLFTRGTFLMSGAFSPNALTPQGYISPAAVEYLWDENADYIDSIYAKWLPFDLSEKVKQLTPADSVGIYFGCGTNDGFLLYPLNEAMCDTLDACGLPYEFYSHTGDHTMPPGFKQGSLIFLDSLLMPSGPMTGIPAGGPSPGFEFTISPNPVAGVARVRLNANWNKPVKIALFNTTGTCLRNWDLYEGGAGKREWLLNLSGYPAGIYFCRVEMNDRHATKKIIKH